MWVGGRESAHAQQVHKILHVLHEDTDLRFYIDTRPVSKGAHSTLTTLEGKGSALEWPLANPFKLGDS